MFEFVYPSFLWALAIIPVFWAYELLIKSKNLVRINYSRMDLLREAARRSSWWKYFPLILRTLVFGLLVIAIAQPRLSDRRELIRGQGIDIVLSIDVSGSMQALDFKPDNRLEAAKNVAIDFVENRKNDRIGVVLFAPYAYTVCPLTSDYNLLKHIISNIDFPRDSSGTAIGMGIATAVARLKDSDAETKIIILITDGLNNTGEIDPITAAHLAQSYGIKIYAVGIGTDGLVDFPFEHPRFGTQYRKVQIDYDMDTLWEVAAITGVEQAWEAANTEEFEQVIQQIDALERSEFEVEHYYKYHEIFHLFIILAMFFLFLEYLYRTVLGFELI
jgi:Ca-activated chloride channel homolog